MKLPKSVLLSLSLAAFLSLQGAQAMLTLPSENLGPVRDVYAGVKFNYLDHQDRLMILNDFLASVKLDYALLPLKKERIGLDFEKLKADAILAETNAQDFIL